MRFRSRQTEAMTTTVISRYRYLGVTDDSTICDKCGRQELKRTVMLVVLDEDGNDEELMYFGSSCAAKALGRTGRGQARKVLLEAEHAQLMLRDKRAQALNLNWHYEPLRDESEAALIQAYREAHKLAIWIDSTSDAEILKMTGDMFARNAAILADWDLLTVDRS